MDTRIFLYHKIRKLARQLGLTQNFVPISETQELWWLDEPTEFKFLIDGWEIRSTTEYREKTPQVEIVTNYARKLLGLDK